MNKYAMTYILGVIALGFGLSAIIALPIATYAGVNEYLLAVLLTILAIAGQIGKVLYKSQGTTGNSTSWYTPLLTFLFAGVFTLSPYLFVAVVVIAHLVEWAIERIQKTPFLKHWYIQPFNIATHIISGLLAWEVYRLIPSLGVMPAATLSNNFVWVLAVVLAGFVYLTINHYLIGQVMVLARKITWTQSGVLNLRNAVCDALFLLGGVGTALLMKTTAFVVVPMILLLLFVQRRLAVRLVK